jgi:hypothetical protein
VVPVTVEITHQFAAVVVPELGGDDPIGESLVTYRQWP